MTGVEGTRSRPRRGIRVLAAAALIAFVIPILLVAGGSGVGPLRFLAPACGCSSTPDPNWTASPPPPVSLREAASNASRIAGVELSPAADWYGVDGTPVSEPSGNGVVGFVEGNTGDVLEILMRDRLPASDAVAITADDARAAAVAFLARGSVDMSSAQARSALVNTASVAFYRAALYSGAGTEPILEVLVNASSGEVFAYRDLRPKAQLPVPVLGYEAAARLATSSSLAAGEAPWPLGDQVPELQIYPGSPDGHDFSWMVGFADGVLGVDAATGEMWVMKWSSPR